MHLPTAILIACNAESLAGLESARPLPCSVSRIDESRLAESEAEG